MTLEKQKQYNVKLPNGGELSVKICAELINHEDEAVEDIVHLCAQINRSFYLEFGQQIIDKP